MFDHFMELALKGQLYHCCWHNSSIFLPSSLRWWVISLFYSLFFWSLHIFYPDSWLAGLSSCNFQAYFLIYVFIVSLSHSPSANFISSFKYYKSSLSALLLREMHSYPDLVVQHYKVEKFLHDSARFKVSNINSWFLFSLLYFSMNLLTTTLNWLPHVMLLMLHYLYWKVVTVRWRF